MDGAPIEGVAIVAFDETPGTGWPASAAVIGDELDEEWQQGFYAEIQDFLESCASGRRPQSDAQVARDTVAALYAPILAAASPSPPR